MKKNGLLIIIIITLCIIIFMLLQDNRKLNSEINSYENYIIDYTMVFLTRDWTIPILSEEELDINSLYQLKGRLDTCHSFAVRTFGLNSDMKDYLFETIKKIEKLTELMEFNNSEEDIKKLLDEIMDLQKEILEKYDSSN